MSSWSVRSLPVFQNWDCHGCTDCCRDYSVHVTDEERRRISAQGWENDPDIGDLPLFVRVGRWWNRRYRLNQRSDGRCLFLDDQGRCRIHEAHGGHTKPQVCRLYPFLLVPAGGHWRVGLRYTCPSAARNQGRPLLEHQDELNRHAEELYRQLGGDGSEVRPPALQGWQRVEWPDLLLFVKAVLALLQQRDDPFERRWRKCLALAALCRQARFEKLQGARLAEFLNLMGDTVDAEVPVEARAVPAPSWVGRLLFRQMLLVYTRQDRGANRRPDRHGWLALLGAAWRFTRGQGRVPRLHRHVMETTFEHLEQSAEPLSAEAEQLLERFYCVKVGSLQFCGPTNFQLAFWDGLESLALTLPVILWLSRAFAELPRDEALLEAVRQVDHHFGANPLLAGRRPRWASSQLSRRGDLAKLIAWYAATE